MLNAVKGRAGIDWQLIVAFIAVLMAPYAAAACIGRSENQRRMEAEIKTLIDHQRWYDEQLVRVRSENANQHEQNAIIGKNIEWMVAWIKSSSQR